jgi:asparagine synthase (glutamine-hydrolysing)
MPCECLSGDFVAYSDSEIITSAVSALPWYYHVDETGALFQGPNVFDIAARGRVPWRWNRRALVSLALFGHTLGADTLCEGVFRVPPAARLACEPNGQLRWTPLRCGFPEAGSEPDVGRTAEALLAAFDDCVRDEPDVFLSLSAGFDSRLLLACALRRGLRPRLGVMGYELTADRIIARRIGHDLGLPIEVVELDPSDYLRQAEAISRHTSGVKLAAHWHTYLYAEKVGVGQAAHLVGSNGEFARSFYLDNPKFNWLADRLPPSLAELYFDVRLARRRMKFSRHNSLVHGAAFNWRPDGPAALARVGGHPLTFADGLDAFYCWQRVRHFIGAGLMSYTVSGRPRSPFLDGRWVAACFGLDRRWKRGNAFHRHCTSLFYPALASYPYQAAPSAAAAESYSPFDDLCRTHAVEEAILDNDVLDVWFSAEQRRRILRDEKADQYEERSFLLTLLYARKSVLEAGLREQLR